MAHAQLGDRKATKRWGLWTIALVVVALLFSGYELFTNEKWASVAGDLAQSFGKQEHSACVFLLPVAIVVSVVGACTFMFHTLGERVARELAELLRIPFVNITIPIELKNTQVVTRSKELNAEIVKAANYHLTVVEKLMAYHYFALLGGLIAGALSAVFGFPIAVLGWNSPGICLKLGFLTSAGLLTFFVAVTKTFRYNDNISKNGDLFQGYTVVLGRLRTGLMVPAKGKTALEESDIIVLVRDVEADLGKLRSIGLAFDSINTSALSIAMPGKHQ